MYHFHSAESSDFYLINYHAHAPATGLSAICGGRTSSAGKSSSPIYDIEDIYLRQSAAGVGALSSAYGGLERLDTFFPFDPCLLKSIVFQSLIPCSVLRN